MKTVLLAGTGTDVGKTHLAEALLQASRPAGSLAAWKPYESGITDTDSDSQRLARAIATGGGSHTHWHAPLHRFTAPLAPPLAARLEGAPLRVEELTLALANIHADIVMIELAGGLFAPLAETWLGIDLVRHVANPYVVLVAPNRLGVLHDTLATLRAAAAEHVEVRAIVMMEQATPDPSAPHNPDLLAELLGARIPIHRLPHAPSSALARTPELNALAEQALCP